MENYSKILFKLLESRKTRRTGLWKCHTYYGNFSTYWCTDKIPGEFIIYFWNKEDAERIYNNLDKFDHIEWNNKYTKLLYNAEANDYNIPYITKGFDCYKSISGGTDDHTILLGKVIFKD